MAPRLGTVNDVLRLMPVVKKSTLYTWRSRGIGPRSFALNGVVVYNLDEVELWIAKQDEATGKGGN